MAGSILLHSGITGNQRKSLMGGIKAQDGKEVSCFTHSWKWSSTQVSEHCISNSWLIMSMQLKWNVMMVTQIWVQFRWHQEMMTLIFLWIEGLMWINILVMQFTTCKLGSKVMTSTILAWYQETRMINTIKFFVWLELQKHLKDFIWTFLECQCYRISGKDQIDQYPFTLMLHDKNPFNAKHLHSCSPLMVCYKHYVTKKITSHILLLIMVNASTKWPDFMTTSEPIS